MDDKCLEKGEKNNCCLPCGVTACQTETLKSKPTHYCKRKFQAYSRGVSTIWNALRFFILTLLTNI